MKRLAVVLCVALCALGLASVASADIMVTAPTLSVPNTSATGSFTVTVEFTGSYNVAGYDIDLLLTGRNSATGLAFAGASGATTNYVFSLPHAGFSMQDNTASHIFGQDFLSCGTETIANVTKNLVTVNYTIAKGTEGVFDVALSNIDGFNDGSNSLGEGFTPGVITITPEPATMALLAVGALAMIRRRR